MVKRAAADNLDPVKRVKIVAELVSIHGVSKTGLSKTLKALYDRGLLTDALTDAPSEYGYMRQVQKAFDLDALHKHTPYGTMLCEMELPIEGNTRSKSRPKSMWYINPFALLFTICTVSSPFFALLKDAVGPSGIGDLRIILYFDGINPGNPLAPNPQRLLQAVSEYA